jgi:hypothetical protein
LDLVRRIHSKNYFFHSDKGISEALGVFEDLVFGGARDIQMDLDEAETLK